MIFPWYGACVHHNMELPLSHASYIIKCDCEPICGNLDKDTEDSNRIYCNTQLVQHGTWVMKWITYKSLPTPTKHF